MFSELFTFLKTPFYCAITLFLIYFCNSKHDDNVKKIYNCVNVLKEVFFIVFHCFYYNTTFASNDITTVPCYKILRTFYTSAGHAWPGIELVSVHYWVIIMNNV